MAVATGQANVAVAWRSRKRGAAASRPWARWPTGSAARTSGAGPSACCARSTRSPCSPAATCTSTAATREQLADVAVTVRRARQPQPGGDDVREAAHRRAVPRRPLDLRAAVPVRQLPGVRRRGRGRHRVAPSGPRTWTSPRPTSTRFAQSIPQQHQVMTNYFGDDPLDGPAWACADLLWRDADLTPADVDVAQLYDAFSPARAAVARGLRLLRAGRGPGLLPRTAASRWDGGRLPVNTSGAGMSEAYVHGFNLITEAVRQVRGHVAPPRSTAPRSPRHLGRGRAHRRPAPAQVTDNDATTGAWGRAAESSGAWWRSISPCVTVWPGPSEPCAQHDDFRSAGHKVRGSVDDRRPDPTPPWLPRFQSPGWADVGAGGVDDVEDGDGALAGGPGGPCRSRGWRRRRRRRRLAGRRRWPSPSGGGRTGRTGRSAWRSRGSSALTSSSGMPCSVLLSSSGEVGQVESEWG